jgi:hypothetical protein
MAYEQGGVRFWGVQYHPEHGPEEALRYLRRSDAGALAGGLDLAPGATSVLVEDAHGAGSERAAMLTDPAVRGAELAAWLVAIGAVADLPAVERRPAETAEAVARLDAPGPGRAG